MSPHASAFDTTPKFIYLIVHSKSNKLSQRLVAGALLCSGRSHRFCLCIINNQILSGIEHARHQPNKMLFDSSIAAHSLFVRSHCAGGMCSRHKILFCIILNTNKSPCIHRQFILIMPKGMSLCLRPYQFEVCTVHYMHLLPTASFIVFLLQYSQWVVTLGTTEWNS